jgi:hypothetical protein
MRCKKSKGILKNLIIGGACGAFLGICFGDKKKRKATVNKAHEVYESVRESLDGIVFEKKKWWEFWKK